MNIMLSKINGYKTYIVAGVTVAYAVVAHWGGTIDTNTEITMILGALGLGALRHGISTKGE